MCTFLLFIVGSIAIYALQEAQKAREEAVEAKAAASEPRPVEIRYVRAQKLPELPDFLQPRQAVSLYPLEAPNDN